MSTQLSKAYACSGGPPCSSRANTAAGCRRRWGQRSDESELASSDDRLAAVGHRELAIDGLRMRLDRVDRDPQVGGDVGVGLQGRQVTKDHLLAVREWNARRSAGADR